MDPNLLTLSFLSALAIGLIAYSLVPVRKEERDAIRRRLLGRRSADPEADIRAKAKDSAAKSLVRKADPLLRRIVMPTSDQEQNNLRVKLANAGFRQAQAQTLYLASKTVLAMVGFTIAAAVCVSKGYSLTNLVGIVAFSAGAGLILPDLWLGRAMASRRTKIRHGLPDTLDLLVVSVESGLGLDAALKRVGEEMGPVHPELSEELCIATMETQMGLRRNEALENLARRTGVDEMRSIVSVVVQAEKFGTSIAKALRNQADAMRVKRRQKAEEKAQQTAVKLMIPLVLFIFPAMGVVLGGPAVISIMRSAQENQM
jgi:tight adherence protein C